jgi:hypothetical protein
MSDVIFHIGIHKTGTSSLQDVLIAKSSYLKDRGIKAYVLQENWKTCHQYFYPEAYESAAVSGELVLKEFETILNDNENQKIIISSEDMSGFMWDWEKRLEKLAKLTKITLEQKRKVKIVCYFRRQDYAYDSIFQELSKKDINLNYKEFTISTAHGIHNVDMNWNNKVEQMLRLLPGAELEIGIFELMKNKDIVCDFFTRLDLNVNLKFLTSELKDTNVSLNSLALGLYNRVKSNLTKEEKENVLAHLMGNDLCLNRLKKLTMSDESSAKLLARYYECNQKLFRKLGIEGFFSEWNDFKVAKTEDISYENFVTTLLLEMLIKKI